MKRKQLKQVVDRKKVDSSALTKALATIAELFEGCDYDMLSDDEKRVYELLSDADMLDTVCLTTIVRKKQV